MTPNTLVVFDLETGGLNWWPHEVNGKTTPMSAITQVAMMAIDRDTGNEIGDPLEIKIKFREELADPKALEINHYDAEVWEREAVAPVDAVAAITFWLGPHIIHKRTSARGKTYRVAELCGHNSASFDIHFLGAFFKLMGAFMPCDWRTLDTLQLAKIYHELTGVVFADYKLATVAETLLGVAPQEDAHDALVDVRTTAAIYMAMMDDLKKARVAA